MVPRFHCSTGHMISAPNGNYVAASDYDELTRKIENLELTVSNLRVAIESIRCNAEANFDLVARAREWQRAVKAN